MDDLFTLVVGLFNWVRLRGMVWVGCGLLNHQQQVVVLVGLGHHCHDHTHEQGGGVGGHFADANRGRCRTFLWVGQDKLGGVGVRVRRMQGQVMPT